MKSFLHLLFAFFLLLPAWGTEAPETLGLSPGPNATVMKDGKPYRGIGVNYFNCFLRTLEKGEDTSYDAGFATLAAKGIPFARFCAAGFWPRDMNLYQHDRAEYFRRLDGVVNSAQKHGIGLVPSLFWLYACVPDLVHEPMDQWANPQSKTQAWMREYVREVVTRYRDNPTIWAWELGNEYSLSANLPNAKEFRPKMHPSLGTPETRSEHDDLTFDIVHRVFFAFATEVKLHDPHRLILTGDSFPRLSAWHQEKENSWTSDTPEQFAEMLSKSNPDPINTIGVHAYEDDDQRFASAMAVARKLNKPLFVGEFGAQGETPEQAAKCMRLVKAIVDQDIPLAALWVFDHPGQNDWNINAENARSWQLDLIAKANKQLNSDLKKEPLVAALQAADVPMSATPQPLVLKAESFRHYVDDFNRNDNELYVQHIPNAKAWEFLQANIPLFDCPDKELEEIYLFRWWTFRKHIKQTPDGFVLSEFLPKVDWAAKYNTINCAAGHHLREGRWLADQKYLDDYAAFWFGKDGNPRHYSFWAADSIWAQALVTGDERLAKKLLPSLLTNYQAWEGDHRDGNGLFWQQDGIDGMEVSISGALHPQQLGYRATINSYMYGDALAIAHIAERAGQKDVADRFRAKAAEIKRLVQDKLWDPAAQFFKVLPRGEDTKLSDARELHGYTPWYFNLPDADKSVAWKQIMDPQGFYAPFGPTTAEQRHPKFTLSYQDHECQWNGPSWPFATAVTLTGLANLLNNQDQSVVTKQDYLALLKIYAKSHHLTREDGRVVPWIDENLNPTNGDWISRTRLKSWENGTWSAQKGGEERGKDYNHSTFCDLVISGLIGLRPRADETVEVNPLVPEGTWDYFCLDQIRYHGHWLTILYDKSGERYGRGKGLRVLADGKEIATADTLKQITGKLQ